MIDFDALWTSDKLASCESSVRVEFLWLYGLADAYGSFELNLRAIHAKVSAIRPRLTLQRLKHIFGELEARGLMFSWQENGKSYAHWTKSDAPGRLPPAKERHRYKKFAPDVPIQRLAEYESRFRRDLIATASPLGVGVGLGLDRKGIGDGSGVGFGEGVGPEGGTSAVQLHTNGNGSEAKLQTQTPTAKSPVQEKSKFNCEYCGTGFADIARFQLHPCGAKTAGGWECRKCCATLPNFAELKEHFRSCPDPEIQNQRITEIDEELIATCWGSGTSRQICKLCGNQHRTKESALKCGRKFAAGVVPKATDQNERGTMPGRASGD
jgi:hypothetical protein